MPQSSLEIVREHIDAYRAQDTERAVSFIDPHVVWDGSRLGVDVTYGLSSLTELVRRYRGTFEGYDYEVANLVDLGAGVVLATVREAGSGRVSGVPVARSTAVLYTVIERKIARITVFPSEQDARGAVEPDASSAL